MLLRLILVCAFIFWAVSAQATVQAGIITPRAEVEIDRDQVLVGDLFNNAGESALRPVGSAPQPGQKSVYDVGALNRVARAYGLDWQATGLETKVVITRASTRISTADIHAAVTKQLHAQLPQANAGIEVQLDRRQLTLDLPAGSGAPDLQLVDVNFNRESFRFTGTLVVSAEKLADPMLVPLTGRALPLVEVPVLSRRLEAGSVIADADLTFITQPLGRSEADVITNAADLLGKETRRALPEGSLVRARDLRPAQLVKRGQPVLLVIEQSGMRIAVQGRALHDAAQGSPVKVLNPQSKKTIEGIVNASGEVLVGVAS